MKLGAGGSRTLIISSRLSPASSRQRRAIAKGIEPGSGQHCLLGAVGEGAEQQAMWQPQRAGSLPPPGAEGPLYAKSHMPFHEDRFPLVVRSSNFP